MAARIIIYPIVAPATVITSAGAVMANPRVRVRVSPSVVVMS